MSVHERIRFEVKPESIEACREAIEEYARYVAGWVERAGPEWRWATYQEQAQPTRFVTVAWHASLAVERRHREAAGTETFAKRLYPHITASEHTALNLVADSQLSAAESPSRR